MAEPRVCRESDPSEPVAREVRREAGAAALSTAFLVVVFAATASAAPGPAPGLAGVTERLGALTVPFEANRGQFAPAVAYAALTFYGSTYVTREGELVHAFAAPRKAGPARADARLASAEGTPAGSGWSLVERFVGGGSLAPRGEASSPTRVSRFHGADPTRWRRDIATYRRVALGRPWPGIGVDVEAHGASVEKTFTVAPGADPRTIEVRVEGSLGLHLDGHGALVAETGNGPVRFAAPRAYQVIDGERRSLAVRYLLHGTDAYSFLVGPHDAGLPLTIDPLLQATYVGGSDFVSPLLALAIDGSGNVIVEGLTGSTDFPGTTGGAQETFGGGFDDGFVARLTPDLGLAVAMSEVPALEAPGLLALCGLLALAGALLVRRLSA